MRRQLVRKRKGRGEKEEGREGKIRALVDVKEVKMVKRNVEGQG